MGRGKEITEYERGQIEALYSKGHNMDFIAQQINRSKKLVFNCIHRGPDQPPGKSTGRKKLLTDRDERNIGRHASNNCISASKVKAELDLPVSLSTVGRAMRSNPHLRHAKKLRKPKITEAQAVERVAFAHDHLRWTDQWKKVIFSDEKKFNLDGPDGWSYYWHDLRKEEVIFAKRQAGGGSVMVWLAFSWDRATPVVFLDGNLTSAKYVNILQAHIVPIVRAIETKYEGNAVFQQDNARPHTAHESLDWLDAKGIDVLNWPAKSPDLNPMENLWGALARRVYAENRQFGSVADLQEAINDAWADIDFDELEPYIESMPDRMEAVITSKGKPTRF